MHPYKGGTVYHEPICTGLQREGLKQGDVHCLCTILISLNECPPSIAHHPRILDAYRMRAGDNALSIELPARRENGPAGQYSNLELLACMATELQFVPQGTSTPPVSSNNTFAVHSYLQSHHCTTITTGMHHDTINHCLPRRERKGQLRSWDSNLEPIVCGAFLVSCARICAGISSLIWITHTMPQTEHYFALV